GLQPGPHTRRGRRTAVVDCNNTIQLSREGSRMKGLRQILAWVFLALAVLVMLGITVTIGWRPFIGPRARALTERKFDPTPARLARGEYLVRSVAHCMDCHAAHDWTAHDAPIRPDALGAGQDMNMLKGLPGKVYAPNITPDPETGAGTWTD